MQTYFVMIMIVLAKIGHISETRMIMVILVPISTVPSRKASSISCTILSFNRVLAIWGRITVTRNNLFMKQTCMKIINYLNLYISGNILDTLKLRLPELAFNENCDHVNAISTEVDLGRYTSVLFYSTRIFCYKNV